MKNVKLLLSFPCTHGYSASVTDHLEGRLGCLIEVWTWSLLTDSLRINQINLDKVVSVTQLSTIPQMEELPAQELTLEKQLPCLLYSLETLSFFLLCKYLVDAMLCMITACLVLSCESENIASGKEGENSEQMHSMSSE